MAEKQKILLCGDVNGNFNTLFSRVESIIKKSGEFDALLCVGTFFGDDNSQLDAYKMGTRKVPVQTYVFGPTVSEHVPLYCEEGAEIVPNVCYMETGGVTCTTDPLTYPSDKERSGIKGRRGIFTTSHDIRIAYLTGASRREGAGGGGGGRGGGGGGGGCEFEPSDCAAVRDAGARARAERGVDMLVTSLWPEGVCEGDGKKTEVPSGRGSTLVAWLAMHLRPRYHFAPAADQYYERQPYRNLSVHQDYRECATRFLSLAPVGNAARQKWLYACCLLPAARMRAADLLQATTDETPCPYDPELLQQLQPGKVVKVTGNGQFFFNTEEDDGGKRRRAGDGPERKRKDIDPDSCWFCLSSPTVEKHLVISVGAHCYLALPRGPLAPRHALVLPIAHHQSVTKAPPEVQDEIKRFKSALSRLYAASGEDAVFFERNFKTSHLQVQSVPVPTAARGQLLEVFQDEAGINGVQLEVLPPRAELAQAAPPGAPYFHAELPTGEQVFARCRREFPLQFGRDVLSSTPILDCEDKADWRQCLLPRDEEVATVAAFRAAFRPYDFTADEDSDED